MVTTQRIVYVSYRRTTGLTDCKLTVYNGVGSAVVSAATMTELANGVYYYDYAPPSSGTFIWYADSTSTTSPQSGSFLSDYSETVTATASTTDYVTTQDLARFINIEGVIPDRTIVGEDRTRELIGTGNSSTTGFYVDNAGVLADTYTVYYGTSEASASALTETTHYTLDKDAGKVTLTATGLTTVGTANLYGAYSYVKMSHGTRLTDTQLQEAIDMATNEFESKTNGRWTDGTATTPNYAKVTDEKHKGQGNFKRHYFLDNYPLPDISTTLNGDLTAAGTAIPVVATSGFPATGTIGIETEKIAYTGKSTTTFTGCSRGSGNTTAATHSDGISVYPFVFEISVTESGSSPSWTMLNPDSEYDLDLNSGRVHVYRDDIVLEQYISAVPPRDVPNRFRASYVWGINSIPDEVKMCVLMMASKNLIHTAFRRTQIDGVDSNARLPDVDAEWISGIIQDNLNYRVKTI